MSPRLRVRAYDEGAARRAPGQPITSELKAGHGRGTGRPIGLGIREWAGACAVCGCFLLVVEEDAPPLATRI